MLPLFFIHVLSQNFSHGVLMYDNISSDFLYYFYPESLSITLQKYVDFPFYKITDDFAKSMEISVNYSQPIERYVKHFIDKNKLDTPTITTSDNQKFPVEEGSSVMGKIIDLNKKTDGRISKETSEIFADEFINIIVGDVITFGTFFVCFFFLVYRFSCCMCCCKPFKVETNRFPHCCTSCIFFFIMAVAMFSIGSFIYSIYALSNVINSFKNADEYNDYFNQHVTSKLNSSLERLDLGIQRILSHKESFLASLKSDFQSTLNNFYQEYDDFINESSYDILSSDLSDSQRETLENYLDNLVTAVYEEVRPRISSTYDKDEENFQEFWSHVETLGDIMGDIKNFQTSVTKDGKIDIFEALGLTELSDFISGPIKMLWIFMIVITIVLFVYYVLSVFGICCSMTWVHIGKYRNYDCPYPFVLMILLIVLSFVVYPWTILSTELSQVIATEFASYTEKILNESGITGATIPGINFAELSGGVINYNSPDIKLRDHGMSFIASFFNDGAWAEYEDSNIYEYVYGLFNTLSLIFSAALDNVGSNTLLCNVKQLIINAENPVVNELDYRELPSATLYKLNDYLPVFYFQEYASDLHNAHYNKYKEVLTEMSNQFKAVASTASNAFSDDSDNVTLHEVVAETFAFFSNSMMYSFIQSSQWALFGLITGLCAVMILSMLTLRVRLTWGRPLYNTELTRLKEERQKYSINDLFNNEVEDTVEWIDFNPLSDNILNRAKKYKPTNSDFFGIYDDTNRVQQYLVI